MVICIALRQNCRDVTTRVHCHLMVPDLVNVLVLRGRSPSPCRVESKRRPFVLGILNASERAGVYELFESTYKRADPDLICKKYCANNGELPAAVRECDGYLLTGNRLSGVGPADQWP